MRDSEGFLKSRLTVASDSKRVFFKDKHDDDFTACYKKILESVVYSSSDFNEVIANPEVLFNV